MERYGCWYDKMIIAYTCWIYILLFFLIKILKHLLKSLFKVQFNLPEKVTETDIELFFFYVSFFQLDLRKH